MSLFEEELGRKSISRAGYDTDIYTMPTENAQEIDFFTDIELVSEAGGNLVCDIEIYPNYYLVAFKSMKSGKVLFFEISPDKNIDFNHLMWVLKNFTIITFNGIGFDLPILSLSLMGAPVGTLKKAADDIIVNNMRIRELEKLYNFKTIKCNHIDIKEVLPGDGSLKLYGGRVHSRKLQDLPHDPNIPLTKEQAWEVAVYCVNDLDTTIDATNSILQELSLRETMSSDYKTNLMSKSDAQIAETVICNEIKTVTGYWPRKIKIEPGTAFKYNVPDFLKFESDIMKEVLQRVKSSNFIVSENGSIELPGLLSDFKISIGNSLYKMGIGGLHSTEKSQTVRISENEILVDRDVASYYPYIILNQGLYPEHLGPLFLDIYEAIVTRRIKAKEAKDKTTANSLKIVINGSFGKFGSKYSALYSPQLLIQTTITGQLSLLMLIEWLESVGISVVSANTDGIVIKCEKCRHAELNRIIREWERRTNFDTEETPYKVLSSRDVNNYYAVYSDGSGYKSKGCFADPGLKKNPTNTIVSEAVGKFLSDGVSVYETILTCKDIRKFISVRTVRGGGQKDGVFLGKVVRWYYKKNHYNVMKYVTSGNKIPMTEGAWPIMTLPDELPTDIDYQWYIVSALSTIEDLGY